MLTFDWNGTPYKTVSCDGAADPDRSTYPSPTGQTASGTCTITASGGPVEITGVMRLGIRPAAAPPRLLSWRAANGGFSFAHFTATRIASIVKQAAVAGTVKPFVVIALGTNDAFAVQPAELEARVATLTADMRSAEITRMVAILPARPSAGWSYPSGSSYDAALGSLVRAYRQEGIPDLPVHAVDMVGESLSADGVHPNDSGNERFAQIVAESLAG